MTTLSGRIEKLEKKLANISPAISVEMRKEAALFIDHFLMQAANEKASGITDGPYMAAIREYLNNF